MHETADLARELLTVYTSFSSLPVGQLAADLGGCPLIEVEPGRAMFDEGAFCQGFPLILDGVVRVARATTHGREIELYRVRPGEFCIVSAACLFGGQALPAHARTIAPTRVIIVPRETFLRWTDDRELRAAVIASLADRMSDLMMLIDTMLSQRLDSRLATALLGRGRILTLTHQRLADDLGTSREIVSRLLGRFEDESLVRLGRERIEVLDPARLRELASGGAAGA